MIKGVIFDLDNCLAPATEVGRALYGPAFEAMRHASHGAIPERVLLQAFDDCWWHPLDWVAARHGFTEPMLAAGWRIFAELEASQPMRGYGDLGILGELELPLFLVTSGFRRLQESKIRMLGLAQWFQAIYVDAIDAPERKGKRGCFQQILLDHLLLPFEVAVVGDNPESEIAVGNELGMVTVQLLRPGVRRSTTATHHVGDLAEFRDWLNSRQGRQCLEP